MKLGNFRRINDELDRIGVNRSGFTLGLWVRRYRLKGRVRFSQDELVWEGSVEEALAHLATMPKGAGQDGFWLKLCPVEAEAHYRGLEEWGAEHGRLEDELRRIDADRSAGAERGAKAWPVDRSNPQEPWRCTMSEEFLVKSDPVQGAGDLDLVERWSGTLEEAYALLAKLPSNAGLEALWRAFRPDIADSLAPDARREQRRRAEERALEAELARVGVSKQELPCITFRSFLGRADESIKWVAVELGSTKWTETLSQKSRWTGTAQQALDRLKNLPNNAGLEQVLKAL